MGFCTQMHNLNHLSVTKMELDADAMRRLEDIAGLSDKNKKFVQHD